MFAVCRGRSGPLWELSIYIDWKCTIRGCNEQLLLSSTSALPAISKIYLGIMILFYISSKSACGESRTKDVLGGETSWHF